MNCSLPFEVIAQAAAGVLVVVAVDAEVLPVRAVGRVVARVSVPVVDGQEVAVLFAELASALGADEAVDSQGLLAVVAPDVQALELLYHITGGFARLSLRSFLPSYAVVSHGGSNTI